MRHKHPAADDAFFKRAVELSDKFSIDQLVQAVTRSLLKGRDFVEVLKEIQKNRLMKCLTRFMQLPFPRMAWSPSWVYLLLFEAAGEEAEV